MSKSSHDNLQPKEERPTISLEDLPEIKRSYEKAKAAGEEQFLFKGQPVLVSYAKYLIEYLESLKGK